MSDKKKRDKRYRPKACVKPLGVRDAQTFEFPGYSALEALGRDHFEEQHVYDLLQYADLVRRIAPEGHALLPVAQDVVEAVAAIQERNLKNGRPGASGEEMKVLRANLGRLMVYLRGQSNVVIWRASQAAIEEFNRLGALKV